MSYGKGLGTAFVIIAILGGIVAIGLWELFKWLYHHVSIGFN